MIEPFHRDDDLAVLHKPAGVSLLRDRSGAPCLWDQLPEALGTRPYLVHRLDKGTSGVLLVALNPRTQRTLTRAFQQRRVCKYYLTWVTGALGGNRTRTIDLPLRKGRKSRYRVAGPRDAIAASHAGWRLTSEAEQGHASCTRIRPLETAHGRTLLVAQPLTGRTHQLRVHLAWIGHPILGDHLYGRPGAPEQRAPRLQLHCHRLVIPGRGAFCAGAPSDWLPPAQAPATDPEPPLSGCG